MFVAEDCIDQVLYTAEGTDLAGSISCTNLTDPNRGKLYRFRAQGKLADFDELITMCRLLGIHGISLYDIGS